MKTQDNTVNNAWQPYNGGSTLGERGSEDGIIRCDESFPLGARITLEEGGNLPWAITCGISGFMVHTAFASTEEEGVQKYEAMKTELAEILERVEAAPSEDEAEDMLVSWAEEFTSRYL